MADENVIQIGVTANVASLKQGMQQAQDVVKQTSQNMVTAQLAAKQAAKDLSSAFKQVGASAQAGGQQAIAILTEYQVAVNRANVALKESSAAAREAMAAEQAAAEATVEHATATEADTVALEQNAVAARHQVTEVQATSGAIRAAFGGGNLRAVERFMATTLGLGPIFQAAFPIIGAIALSEMLVKMGREVIDLADDYIHLKKETSEAWKGIEADEKRADAAIKEYVKNAREAAVLHAELNGGKQGAAARGREAGDKVDLTQNGLDAATATQNLKDANEQLVIWKQRLEEAKESQKGTPSIGFNPVGSLINKGSEISGGRDEQQATNEINHLKARIQAETETLRVLGQQAGIAKDKGTLAKRDEEPRDTSRKAATEQLRGWELQVEQQKAAGKMAATTEEDFWNGKLAALKKGSDEYREVAFKAAEAQNRVREATVGQGEQAERETKQGDEYQNRLERAERAQLEAAERESDAKVKKSQEASAKTLEIVRQEIEEEDRLAQESHQQQVSRIDALNSLGATTGKQKISQLRAASDEEYQARLQAAEKMKVVDVNNPEKYQQDLSRQLQIQQQHNAQSQALDLAAMQQKLQAWRSFESNVNSGAQTALNGWLQGTQTLQQAFTRMFDGILVGMANFAAQWLLKKAEMWAMDAIITRFFQGQTAVASVISNAAVAGSAAAAATAAIPIIGPGLAIPAGAAMMGGVTAAFAPFAEYAQGTDFIPRQGIAMLHPGEAVLNNTAADQYRKGGMGGTTIHNHFSPTLTGPDHAAAARAMYPEFRSQMAREFRNSNQ